MRKRKKLYLILCAVLLGIICVAGWQIARILLEYRAGEQAYEQLTKLSRPDEDSDKTASTRDFAALQAVNPDVLAWITIPDTGIDYPVVQGDDNQYYLKRLVTGEWNKSGSIFLDCQASPDFSDPYSIIYGHNMLNGTMFSDLMKFKEQAFYDAHPSGTLETPDATYTILFFAGIVADVKSPVWNTAQTKAELPEWAAGMKELSCFDSQVTPTENDRIVALATCTYEFSNARFVLLGILR